MDHYVLQVKDLNVSYTDEAHHLFGANQKKAVCKNISFSIKQGEIVGLLGESGCGKSTLAKAITHMVKADSGEIELLDPHPMMIFQDPYGSLNPAKKIGWILEEPLKIKGGYSREERRAKVFSMLEKVGLEPKIADHFPSQLSGGQRQRVAIGVALILEPKLLIADEPVSALDVTIQAQIIRLLLKLHKEMGLSILFISHDLRVVYQMSDRVMVMKQGSIVEQGELESVYENPKTPYMQELLKSAGIQYNSEEIPLS